jgi:cell division transport system permease protein
MSPLVSDVVAGLRRNLATTAAVVVTVAICLALLGAGLLIQAQVRTIDAFLLDRIEVVVDLTDDLTPEGRDELAADLRSDPLIESVVYESKQQVFERFRRDFRDSPDVVAGIGPEDLPASFRLTLTDPRAADEIIVGYTGRDGVEAVRDQRGLLEPLYRFLDGFATGAFALAAVQAFAALVLVHTMIRISAHGRRRETSIKRLVGATNATIRAPFVVESAVAGLVGGLLAGGALVLVKIYVVDRRFGRQAVLPLFGWDTVWTIVGALVVLGVSACGVMAALSLRRQLQV